MKPKINAILHFLFFVFPSLCFCQQQQLWNEVRKIIRFESGIDFQVVQGMVIGVWDHDSTYFLTYGEDLDKDDHFELGSLTKPLVAYLTEQIICDHAHGTNVSMCLYMPDSICSDAWNHVTVAHLLHHRAGLTRMPEDIGLIEKDVRNPYEFYSADHLASDLKDISPKAGLYSYSQLDYAALYWLFEKAGGADHVVRKHFAQKMNLHNTRMDVVADELAPGFGFDGKLQPPWNTNAFSLSLGLKSTAADIISFMKQRSPIFAEGCGKWTKALKKEMHALEKSKAYKLCEGWFLIESGKKDLIFYQTGRTGGHHAAAAFIPGREIGVVVFTAGVSGSNDLCFSILTMLRRAKKNKT